MHIHPLTLAVLELLGELVFAIGSSRNVSGEASSGVEDIGVGSTYSLSSKSVDFNDIAREKSLSV